MNYVVKFTNNKAIFFSYYKDLSEGKYFSLNFCIHLSYLFSQLIYILLLSTLVRL